MAVNMLSFFKRIIAGDKTIEAAIMTRRHVIVWVFIAVVALFLTHPSSEPQSRFDRPLPLPAELGLE